MRVSLDGYELVGEGADSDVFREIGKDRILKIYGRGIPFELIMAYHKKQTKLSRLAESGFKNLKDAEKLPRRKQQIEFNGNRIRGITCSILALDTSQVFRGTVDRYDGERVVTTPSYIDGETLAGPNPDEPQMAYDDPLIKEIEMKLTKVGVPVRSGLGGGPGYFTLNPINIKVIGFKDQILSLTITDLAAQIRVSMGGHV